MESAIQAKVLELWSSLPDSCKKACATQAEIEAFEAEFSRIPAEFAWFLVHLGGGPIGTEWVDSIAELPGTHHKFNAEVELPNGWRIPGVFVIGWDGAGNPFGICQSTGSILAADHDFGGVHTMASSFGSFLLSGLRGEAG